MLETIQKPTTPILVKDLGMIYGTETSKEKRRYGIYRCECGNEFRALTYNVKNGKIVSCRCYWKQLITTHGATKHKLFSVWNGIIARTTNENEKSFKDYGARGIKMCDEWINSPQAFFAWCYENGYEKGLQIDRINNDGNYEPLNCRFVIKNINARNTRILKSTNTSGYRGVSWHKRDKVWAAGIGLNGKRKYIGSFATPLEAAIAYDRFVIENNLEHTKNGVL